MKQGKIKEKILEKNKGKFIEKNKNKCWGKLGKAAENDSVNTSFLLSAKRIFYGMRSKKINFVNVSHTAKLN